MATKDKCRLEEILGASITRGEALEIISSNEKALKLFNEMDVLHQEEIIAFIQGSRGLPILYDGFYKHAMDPEIHPERLESFLSGIMKQTVKIERVMPREGIQLAETGSLVIMDIIVRLEDGSIVDIELQKQGYLFPGERSDCYQADMVMRQYNRIRNEKKKEFKYSDMKPIYLIILMENSSKQFQKVKPNYIHRVKHVVDSGAELTFLTNLVYISLDTFRQLGQNISDKTEAWLTFLSSDKPEDILHLVEKYPEFKECYKDIREFRKKPEELMDMISKALRETDKSTERYMVRELQKEVEAGKKALEEQEKALEEQGKVLEEKDKKLEEKDKKLEEKDKKLKETEKELQELREKLKVLQENNH